MDSTITAALRAPEPGWMVRLLSPAFSGVRATRDQIHAYAEHWRDEAEAVLAGDEPFMVALGDSLSQGIGASSIDKIWLHRIAEAATPAGADRLRIVNFSRSGARIDDVVNKQLPALCALPRPPALVTLTVGSNDLVRSGLLGSAVRSLTSVLDEVPAGSLIATVPAKGSMQAKRLNKRIRSIVADSDHVLADVDAHLPGWRNRSAGDRFHPNDLGYEAWTAAFTEALDGRPVTVA